MYTPNLQIDTPENVVLETEIAGVGSRCVAAFFDYLYLAILSIILAYFLTRSNPIDDNESTWTIAVLVGLEFLLITFYHLLFEIVWNGQTPGKRHVGIRVVHSDGTPVSISGAMIRNLVRLFDFLPPIYGLGLLMLFVTDKTQRLGDLAAGTLVIREQTEIIMYELGQNKRQVYRYISRYNPLPHYIRLDNLDEKDQQQVALYLQRRDTLVNQQSVAQPLAKRIAEKIGDQEGIHAVTQVGISIRNLDIFLEQINFAHEIRDRTKEENPRIV